MNVTASTFVANTIASSLQYIIKTMNHYRLTHKLEETDKVNSTQLAKWIKTRYGGSTTAQTVRVLVGILRVHSGNVILLYMMTIVYLCTHIYIYIYFQGRFSILSSTHVCVETPTTPSTVTSKEFRIFSQYGSFTPRHILKRLRRTSRCWARGE